MLKKDTRRCWTRWCLGSRSFSGLAQLKFACPDTDTRDWPLRVDFEVASKVGSAVKIAALAGLSSPIWELGNTL